jgi:hypothetical protein
MVGNEAKNVSLSYRKLLLPKNTQKPHFILFFIFTGVDFIPLKVQVLLKSEKFNIE